MRDRNVAIILMAFCVHSGDYACSSCLLKENGNYGKNNKLWFSYAGTDDYQEFYEALKLLNGKKLTESTYVINTTLNKK